MSNLARRVPEGNTILNDGATDRTEYRQTNSMIIPNWHRVRVRIRQTQLFVIQNWQISDETATCFSRRSGSPETTRNNTLEVATLANVIYQHDDLVVFSPAALSYGWYHGPGAERLK